MNLRHVGSRRDVDDHLQDAFQRPIVEDIPGSDAHDAYPMLGEPAVALPIVVYLRRMVVMRTVDLDGEAGLGAVEIEDVAPDRMLTPEPQAFNAPRPQAVPQQRFGQAEVTTEFASTDEGFLGGSHGCWLVWAGYISPCGPCAPSTAFGGPPPP